MCAGDRDRERANNVNRTGESTGWKENLWKHVAIWLYVFCSNLHDSCAHVNVKLSLVCIRLKITSNQELATDCFYCTMCTFNEFIEQINLNSLCNREHQFHSQSWSALVALKNMRENHVEKQNYHTVIIHFKRQRFITILPLLWLAINKALVASAKVYTFWFWKSFGCHLIWLLLLLIRTDSIYPPLLYGMPYLTNLQINFTATVLAQGIEISIKMPITFVMRTILNRM